MPLDEHQDFLTKEEPTKCSPAQRPNILRVYGEARGSSLGLSVSSKPPNFDRASRLRLRSQGLRPPLLLVFLPHDPSSDRLISASTRPLDDVAKTDPQIAIFPRLVRAPIRPHSHARVSEVVTPILAQQAECVY